MRHTEDITRVTEVRAVNAGDYVTFEVDYTTAHGIKRTMRLAHCEADQIRAAIVGEYETMGADEQKRSFWASLRRKR